MILPKYTRPIWSIGVYKGPSLEDIINGKKFDRPALTANSVTDIKAEFIADPFIIRNGSKYYMFFEVLGLYDRKGRIGMASSDCGVVWKYDRIVLDEPFHLSYPYVFQWQNEYYMLPDNNSGYVKLYRAKEFPYVWECTANLLEGTYGDASLLYNNDKFWMFVEKKSATGQRNCDLYLFYSSDLGQGWIEHPKSPLFVDNPKQARPAGRIINLVAGETVRFSQNDEPYYGKNINMHKIIKLSVDDYEEEVVEINLKGSGRENDWRKDGMHHIDCCKINENEWLAVVDGHYFKEISHLQYKWQRLIYRILKRIRYY